MSEELLKRIHEIFEAASDVARSDRAAVLLEKCGDDIFLLREVERLFRHYDLTEGRGEGLALGSWPADPELPARIGPYRILEVLGSGGMGIVYLAEQEQPRRRVALKIIHPAQLGDSTRKRLELEAEALGRLKHRCIAQIFEAGRVPTPPGPQHFIAMEYVEERRALMAFVEEENSSRTARIGGGAIAPHDDMHGVASYPASSIRTAVP